MSAEPHRTRQFSEQTEADKCKAQNAQEQVDSTCEKWCHGQISPQSKDRSENSRIFDSRLDFKGSLRLGMLTDICIINLLPSEMWRSRAFLESRGCSNASDRVIVFWLSPYSARSQSDLQVRHDAVRHLPQPYIYPTGSL